MTIEQNTTNPNVNIPSDYEDIIEYISNEIVDGGDNLHPVFIDKLDEPLIRALIEVCEKRKLPFIEFMKNSNRYASVDRFAGLFDPERTITIPKAPDNLHHNGALRREEVGEAMDLEYLIGKGVDPRFVLYYRVTQPSTTPKPEYYWTSDYTETKYGLGLELGPSATTAIILVSSLEDIYNANDGLINDINDDSGIAVRQIGLGSFDQSKALLTLVRPNGDERKPTFHKLGNFLIPTL